MSIAPLRVRAVAALGAVCLGASLISSSACAKSSDTDPVQEGEILLRLRSTSALAPLLARYELEEISQFGSRPIYRLGTIGTNSLDETLDALALETDVLSAETHPAIQSPEARRNAAWAIGEESDYVDQWAPSAVRLQTAHSISKGNGVRVAVLDTGVDRLHPGLEGRLIPGWDFVDDDNDPGEVGNADAPGFGHGTHVTGVVAQAAPGAQIMPVRILDPEGMGNLWVLVEALMYAVDPDRNPDTDDGAHVINLSLGTANRSDILRTVLGLVTCAVVNEAGELPGPAVDPAIDVLDPGYDDDRDRCRNFPGSVVVVSAGNDGSKRVRQYPAGAGVYGMISVGASDATGSLAGFSNYGSWVDIAAPGDGITSFIPGGVYGTWSGTSMAAPYVTGTAALLISRNPEMHPRDITRRIERSSTELCDGSLHQLDAAAALGDVGPGEECP